MNRVLPTALMLGLAACGTSSGDAKGGNHTTSAGAGAAGGAGGAGLDPAGNEDGDCLTNAEELEKGTDPLLADSDGDGIGDCDEIACVSNPTDANEHCYACGWKHNDPGTLQSTGAKEGDVIANVDLIDQCQEAVHLWDFAQEYHILFMTAAW